MKPWGALVLLKADHWPLALPGYHHHLLCALVVAVVVTLVHHQLLGLVGAMALW
jgi:hypothetical protein